MPTSTTQTIVNDDFGLHGAGSSRFRHRKISLKQHLRIYKPSDLKNLDKKELQQRDVVDVETGVEKNEEKEVHLHRILLKGTSQINEKKKEYIPTPDVNPNWPQFDAFYERKFQEPSAYIKFSATVEDCCGSNYNMDEEDDAFLNDKFNKQILKDNPNGEILTEDEFEILCTAFESAIAVKQPFLSMDPESILSFEELKPSLLKVDLGDNGLRSSLAEELNFKPGKRFLTQFDPESQIVARPVITLIDIYGSEVYEYWKSRKIVANGANIFPQLRFERPGEKEEVDPYVCFRRREVRHPRKTRRIDIINCQKLRSLHKELKRAKELILLVAKREQFSSNLLKKELDVFNDRIKIKNLKRSLNIRGEEDDLINHKRKRIAILTIEKRREIEEEEAHVAQLAREKAAVEAEAAAASNSKKSNKNKNLKKHLEQLLKSGQKLTKQQLQQLQQLQKGKSDTSLKNLKKEEVLLLQQQNAKQQLQQSISSHVYVKLPLSKVPDIVLEDVDRLLTDKEKNAKRFVQERMEKRKLEDGDVFFNLTDDPYNPVFEINLPKTINSSDAAFSSIASSKFEIEKSYYMPKLNDYLNGTTDEIKLFNEQGEKIDNADNNLKKIERYNPFQNEKEIHSREYPVKFRKRIGRCGIQYIDRKPNESCRSVEDSHSMINDFIDFDAVENEEKNSDATINVYDSKTDELSRLLEKWKFDSPNGLSSSLPFSEEPSRLNKLSNETQVIRFGAMLGSKSYEQLRKATMIYRRDYINKIREQKALAQKQLQQQLQSQNNPSNQEINQKKGTNNNSSKFQTKKSSDNSDNVVKNESRTTETPSPNPSQSTAVSQKT